MSENATVINITDSNSTNSSTGGITDRVFDIGFKLLIPLVLVLVLGGIVVFIVFVLPLLTDALGFGSEVIEGTVSSGSLFGGITSALLSWVLGRN